MTSKIINQLNQINRISRTNIPISELTVALQCGGSDSYSGITANPALGFASDMIIDHGGTTLLSVTTEIYGAEHLLFEKSSNEKNIKNKNLRLLLEIYFLILLVFLLSNNILKWKRPGE